MTHPLDRPIWTSLATRQGGLGLGDARARRFHPDYAMFAAAADRSEASRAALTELVRVHGEAALVEADEPDVPPRLAVASHAVLLQMAADPAELKILTPGFDHQPLTDDDGPQMLALATLTKPGPFYARTHQLGDFVGVKRDGELIAMAGERMKPEGFTEVSGVCAHPDHRGHGYAAGLMSVVAQRILARGETPFLHVYDHNAPAIALYERLGYRLRREMRMLVVEAA
ncbi:GNAT family N-acetyltransferase [Phenylobacterium sp.]|uniref:GNAT family N-acetyltransferase n=1 Tax=Phenylobacterium sp. TaxID=1871053 RepID=UPI002DE7F60D|nr:GNAT family N-acetyltransferase [Phenylobacterium sp.]